MVGGGGCCIAVSAAGPGPSNGPGVHGRLPSFWGSADIPQVRWADTSDRWGCDRHVVSPLPRKRFPCPPWPSASPRSAPPRRSTPRDGRRDARSTAERPRRLPRAVRRRRRAGGRPRALRGAPRAARGRPAGRRPARRADGDRPALRSPSPRVALDAARGRAARAGASSTTRASLLYELGSLTPPPRRCSRAARRLDPTLPHVREQPRRARAAAAPGVARRLPARRSPSPCRASPAAPSASPPRARPAEGLTLSLCMIVKDEEEMLPRCLAAVARRRRRDRRSSTPARPTARSRSRESFGAKVIEREWTGSFADARNVSFDAATGDWLMFLDADEVLVAEDAERLRALAGRTWREAFYLVETNYTGELGDGTAVTHNALRVFRNRPEYRFEGRIHEQIAHNAPELPARAHRDHRRPRRALRLPRRRPRREGEVAPQHRAARAPARRGRRRGPVPALQPRLRVRGRSATNEDALRELRDRLGAHARQARPRRLRLHPGARRAPRARAARHRPPRRRRSSSPTRACASFPGFTDLVFEQALAAAEARRTPRRAIALYERCLRDGRRPEQVLGDRRAAARTCRSSRSPNLRRERRRRRRGGRAARRAASTSTRSYFGAVGPFAVALLATGAEPAGVVARDRGARRRS